jgi:Coenzyme PQQ synthesis protein D (PqqD)
MRFRRAAEATFDVLDGHAVIIDPGAVRMLTLNPVGTLVWQHLDVDRTCEELTAMLLPMLTGISVEQLALDIASFLDELMAAGLVVASDQDA